jgi:hypothetical protein
MPVCRTENVLHETGDVHTLAEIRETNIIRAIEYLDELQDRREENRNNTLPFKITVEEKPMRTKRPILVRNPKGSE